MCLKEGYYRRQDYSSFSERAPLIHLKDYLKSKGILSFSLFFVNKTSQILKIYSGIVIDGKIVMNGPDVNVGRQVGGPSKMTSYRDSCHLNILFLRTSIEGLFNRKHGAWGGDYGIM